MMGEDAHFYSWGIQKTLFGGSYEEAEKESSRRLECRYAGHYSDSCARSGRRDQGRGHRHRRGGKRPGGGRWFLRKKRQG